MQTSAVPLSMADRQGSVTEIPIKNEAYSSGVSWAAVIGGAFVSASLALILLSLGTGLGFSLGSPWSNLGASASTVGKGAVIWLILTQIVASAMGGYLAGRLRTKWTQVHTDEIYFRDTAHGFLVWAVGMVITASLLASAATSFAGAAARQRSDGAATTTATDEATLNPNAYFVDTLLRSNSSASDRNASDRNDSSERAEVSRTFAHALHQGAIPAPDGEYLSRVVSTRTGLNQADAQSRVSDVFAAAQQSEESARKTLGHLSLWLFVALLSGAFCASYAGTIGGRQRDRIVV
jgi:hypothetical protein